MNRKKIAITLLFILLLCSITYSKNSTVGSNKLLTVLLVGLDNRGINSSGNKYYNGNTDTLIIGTLNQETGEVKISSIFRDNYVKDSDNKWKKINSVFSHHEKKDKGQGINGLMNVINSNYGVKVHKYIVFSWKDVADGIDKISNVSMQFNENEVKYFNAFVHEVCESFKILNPAEYYINETGYHTLNGIQCVAFMRLRLGDSDIKRVQRQQEIINKLLNNFMKLNIAKKTELCYKFIDGLNLNFSPLDFINMLKVMNNIQITSKTTTPHLDNYLKCKGVPEWASIPKSIRKASKDLQEDIYNYHTQPTTFLDDLEIEAEIYR